MKKKVNFTQDETVRPKEPRSLCRSYDIVGDIAVIRVPGNFKPCTRIVTDSIMRAHPQVKTVLEQTGAVSGDYRLRQLEWIAGEKKTETVHRESGCVFKVDLKTCYFSPRLSFERMRVVRLVEPNDVIVNMFAGVGCFSILIAKHGGAKRVYTIDVNPIAVEYSRENIRLNRVQSQVVPALGDARQIIMQHLKNVADVVIMPLPEKAYEYFDCAADALKLKGGRIHYYDFEHASKYEDPVGKVRSKLTRKLSKLGLCFKIPFGRVVRSTGPHWCQVALDVQVLGKGDQP